MKQVQQTPTGLVPRITMAVAAASLLLTTVPLYGISFALAGPHHMICSAASIYKSIATDSYLFRHLLRMARIACESRGSGGSQAKLFRNYYIHPFFAGLSILTSGALVFVMLSSSGNKLQHDSLALAMTANTPTLLSTANMLVCISMAQTGSKLIPTMYGNSTMKLWTRVQQYLIVTLSTTASVLVLMTRFLPSITDSSMTMVACAYGFVALWNFTLLACAGILQRIYVVSILPFLMRFQYGEHYKERGYIQAYSQQAKCTTVLSFALAIHLFHRCQ